MKQIQRGLVAVIAFVSVQCSEASAPEGEPPAITSPSGRIAFVTEVSPFNGALYIANSDGSGLRQLTSGPAYHSRPRWSPDRRRIVFARGSSGSATQVYVIDVDGPSAMVRVADGWDPAWSPDGSKIVFTSSGGINPGVWGIHVMNADGSDVRRLTYPNDPVRCPQGSTAMDLRPDWSPDGRRILFERRLHTSDDGDGYDCGLDGWGYRPNVYVMNADGTGLRRLGSISTREDADPSWSPDGRLIAFSVLFDGLYVIDNEGAGPEQRVAVPLVGWGSGPVWSPDGKRLLFLNVNVPNNQLAVVDIATGVTQVLSFPTVSGHLSDPAWSR